MSRRGETEAGRAEHLKCKPDAKKEQKNSNTIRLLLRLCQNRMFTFILTNASKTERQQIQSQCFTLSKYSDLYYILPASSYSTVCRQAEHDETAVRPRQEVRGRAKAKAQLMKPSRDRGRKAEARPSRGRQLPRQSRGETGRKTASRRSRGKAAASRTTSLNK